MGHFLTIDTVIEYVHKHEEVRGYGLSVDTISATTNAKIGSLARLDRVCAAYWGFDRTHAYHSRNRICLDTGVQCKLPRI